MSKRQARILGNLELSVSSIRDWRMRKTYSGFAIIMMAVLVLSMADSWLVRFELGIGVGVGVKGVN